jgi:transposase
VAVSAEGVPALEHGVRVLRPVAGRRDLASHPRRATRPGPGRRRARTRPDRGDHRLAVGAGRRNRRQGQPGFDGGKNVNGRKRHIAVDACGLLLVALVTVASIQDRDAGLRLLALLRERFATVSLVWADGGYAGRLVSWVKRSLAITMEVVKRTDDNTGFKVVPRRWVVERTFAWLFTSRRLVHDYERLPSNHEAMIHLSMILLMTRRLAPAPKTP